MEYKGTIRPKEPFDPTWSAERFKKALKFRSSDERVLIHLVVSHSNSQRLDAAVAYQKLYKSDLIEDIKSELGGNFHDAVLALMANPDDLLVNCLHEAIEDGEEKTIIEILCNRSAQEIQLLNDIYGNRYGKSLETAFSSHLAGDFLMLMKSLVSESRNDNKKPDVYIARKEAQDLYDTTTKSLAGIDTSRFTQLMNVRSYIQLRETFKEFEKLSLEPIEKIISDGFTGSLKHALLAIILRVKDPAGFFAERLNESLRGADTDDRTLIRVIISRSEIDLEDIKRRYREMYGTTLITDVRADTTGDYRKLLMAIVRT